MEIILNQIVIQPSYCHTCSYTIYDNNWYIDLRGNQLCANCRPQCSACGCLLTVDENHQQIRDDGYQCDNCEVWLCEDCGKYIESEGREFFLCLECFDEMC